MKFVIESVAIGFTLFSCSTLVTNSPKSDYAPESLSTSRSGVVAYNPDGLKELVDARRENAYKKMFEFCGSKKYTISKEETVSARDTEAAQGIANFGADKVVQMHFTCN